MGASYQTSVHLAVRFPMGRFFRIRSIRNKNCIWQPCLLTNWEEMRNPYRGPSIDAFYQVSVHLAKLFQGRRFCLNQPIRNKKCMCWPCLLTDWHKSSILHSGPSIDASCQVSIHLVKGFQRRRFLEIGQSERRFACRAMFVNGSGPNKHSL